jgi:hypothetical protein
MLWLCLALEEGGCPHFISKGQVSQGMSLGRITIVVQVGLYLYSFLITRFDSMCNKLGLRLGICFVADLLGAGLCQSL